MFDKHKYSTVTLDYKITGAALTELFFKIKGKMGALSYCIIFLSSHIAKPFKLKKSIEIIPP